MTTDLIYSRYILKRAILTALLIAVVLVNRTVTIQAKLKESDNLLSEKTYCFISIYSTFLVTTTFSHLIRHLPLKCLCIHCIWQENTEDGNGTKGEGKPVKHCKDTVEMCG